MIDFEVNDVEIIMRQTLMLGSDSKGSIWQRIKDGIFGNVQANVG